MRYVAGRARGASIDSGIPPVVSTFFAPLTPETGFASALFGAAFFDAARFDVADPATFFVDADFFADAFFEDAFFEDVFLADDVVADAFLVAPFFADAFFVPSDADFFVVSFLLLTRESMATSPEGGSGAVHSISAGTRRPNPKSSKKGRGIKGVLRGDTD